MSFLKYQMQKQLFTEYFQIGLYKLLDISTVTILETKKPSRIKEANNLFTSIAESIGFDLIFKKDVEKTDIDTSIVPQSVIRCIETCGDVFFKSQQNIVLQMGSNRSQDRTIMFNVHMDTVSNHLEATFDGKKFFGRGAVDMKGPAVAILAGIGALRRHNPEIFDDIKVLIQCVCGEEGGAMGTFGTKTLIDKDYIGALNIFAEPSSGYFFDFSSNTMTAEVQVNGLGTTDDEPQNGHNATVVLGFLAQYIPKKVSQAFNELDSKVCVAGVHTGNTHNRVYGAGTLFINISYTNQDHCKLIESLVEHYYLEGISEFSREFYGIPFFKKTVKDVAQICKLSWLKINLPVLKNRNVIIERLLAEVGLKRLPSSLKQRSFTCDAPWAQKEDVYTIVYGPGSLAINGAHTEHEYLELIELEKYAHSIYHIVSAFHTYLQNRDG